MKTRKEIWGDIILFLAKDDITKMEDIKNMQATKVFFYIKFEVKSYS